MNVKLVQVMGYGRVAHLTLDGVNPICNASHRHPTREIKGRGRTVTCRGCRDARPAMQRRLDRLFS